MTLLDPELVETLLRMNESSVLDFKRTQYPFAGADENTKGELVKDIVAFANAWKESDAHIVIGAEDGKGQRAIIHGVAEHLDDAALQQLVNSKTNRRVDFTYLAATVDGCRLAVIRVARDQQRPIVLSKPFGRLKADVVYFRRGSSTAEAGAGEIEAMVTARLLKPEPRLELHLGSPASRHLFGPVVRLEPRVLVPRRTSPVEDSIRAITNVDRELKRMAKAANEYASFDTLVECRKRAALYWPVAFMVSNTGRVLLEDVSVTVEADVPDGVDWVDEPPPLRPSSAMSATYRSGPSIDLYKRGASIEFVAQVGKVQPGAKNWSGTFWLASSEPKAFSVVASVRADNLEAPVVVPVNFELAPREEEFDMDDFDSVFWTGTG